MKNILFYLPFLLLIIGCNNSIGQISQNDKSNSLIVGVFSGNGASPICVIETLEALKIDPGISPEAVSAADIMNGKLDSLDVLVFPGGSGSKEYNNMGQQAVKKVKDFAYSQGKGLVGICAGGYLFSDTKGYPSMKILDSPDIREYYDRGRGLISFSLNEKGKRIFPELINEDSLYVQYYDGPIFKLKENSKINVVGNIYSDIATHKGYPHDVTPGKPSFFTMDYGKSKVFVSVGHPEATAGMRWMVPRMVRYVANKELISYPKELIRPYLNDKEILFYKSTKKIEKDNWWNLFSDDDSEVIQALENLYNIRSRPSIRWSIGLLRHDSFKVRLAAANHLLNYEYTFALPDIEAAVNAETIPSQKALLEKIYFTLKSYIE